MAPADYDLLRRLHYLSLLAQRGGGSPLLAAPKKKLPAGGTEVTALRDYAPGDDYRLVDWAWCARRDELLTRVFEGQPDLHTYLLVDCSASMAAGRPAKFHLARRIAAALGYVSLVRLDRLVVASFAGSLSGELPPLRHPTRFPRLLQGLDGFSIWPGQTDLAAAVRAFVGRDRRRGPVVVLSDFYDRGGFAPALDLLRYHGYEPRLVQIVDPSEAESRTVGDLELVDVETDEARQVTITPRMAARYRVLLARFQDSLREYCGRRGIPQVRIASTMPEEEILRRVILGR
jgi:uncharacterized protein (DUF58 family)